MKRSEQIKSAIIHTFQEHHNEENRPAMEAYMKHQFLFYGIKSPERTAILRPIYKEYSSISETERMDAAILLFQQPERECHYAALELLEKGVKNAVPSSIAVYKELMMTASWWDTVDMIASKLCGGYFKRYPERLRPITENWSHSSNLWVRRSSMLHQLKYKEATNKELLFETACQLKDEKEFFIEKAIGWALREYSKTDTDAVVQLLESVSFRPLTKREGLKWAKNKGLLSS
ncbi:DNA-7-methylguanine glycosylase [Halobacillus alkaliphilus]|uniref:DNA-7-methylguanine glycosylase n=1 Tax=Halobacillus alkaliphilus TaxID=396056 RepID=A0A1I2RCZ6_9BACI|nr:DNA alkylation repair protein [Halobacillus alkaliphilus]SFG35656.1 DNA-7-methylguanine glycosylase [Halobacillus alkaliphilus]